MYSYFWRMTLAEGGIRSALTVSGPVVQRQPGSINGATLHVADIMPTVLEVAGVDYPETYENRRLPPLMGKSWIPLLAAQTDSIRTDDDFLAWEVFGHRAVRQGNWKLRWQVKPFGTGDWELFDLANDPGERHDLAAEHQDKVVALVAKWDEYVEANNVILPNRTPFEGLEDTLPPRVPVDEGFPPLLYKKPFVPPPDQGASRN